MPEIVIEQALYHRTDGEEPQLVAKSAGCQEEWLAEAARLVLAFGDRPVGVQCPEAVFAYPLTSDLVAVVSVADQHDGTIGFRLLIVPRSAYEQFFGNPFDLARRLPADWQARDNVGALTLPAQAPAPPRVQEVQSVLQRVKSSARADAEPMVRTVANSESPALLGGVQVLVDGGRVVFERPEPTGVVPALWTLLPASTRATLWPASFAFSNQLGFDALVVPRARGPEYDDYTTEDQAADYPPGRYELALQTAAEAGDQRHLDQLFGRRSWAETWRLGITLLIALMLLSLASRVLDLLTPPPTSSEKKINHALRLEAVVAIVGQNEPLNTLGILPGAREVWFRAVEE